MNKSPTTTPLSEEVKHMAEVLRLGECGNTICTSYRSSASALLERLARELAEAQQSCADMIELHHAVERKLQMELAKAREDRKHDALWHLRNRCEHDPVPSGDGQVCRACGLEL